jgi:WD40-like Beta Propeller Repeat
MRPLTLIALVIATVMLLPCASAGADVFGGLQMADDGFLEGHTSEVQQALYAHDTAISGNGEYVAFDGYFAGLVGVWRRDLATGAIQPVAVGAQVSGSEECAQPACDAELPSISANGQFISFTTTAPLDPEDDSNEAPDVYVRNMDVPESQPGAYTLVSAVNGKTEGLSYEGSSAFGSVAAGRSAISANGEEVAFVTTAVSNLASCQEGAPAESACSTPNEAPTPTTPALQVAVRNIVTDTTELVSEEYDPATGQPIPDKPVSQLEGGSIYGAVYTAHSAPPQFPFDNRAYDLPPVIGASISGDGTTVAWMGTTVYKQARMLSEENSAKYAEPLWRRIADGPLAPTRRVTGGSEPENPLCIASGETSVSSESASNPCQGPFAVSGEFGVWAGTIGDTVPQLSANGDTVAFLATAKLIALGEDFGLSGESELDDLYLSNMQEGLSRKEALRPLTQLVAGSEGSEPIVDLAINAEGTQVAFSTKRIEFPLAFLDYVSEPQSVVGLAELFDVDLQNDTLTRVTGGYEGGPGEHPHTKVLSGEQEYKLPTDGALSPSFSDTGDTLAFSSTASNLVYGDGNTPAPSLVIPNGSADGSDAFAISRLTFPPEPADTYVSDAPAGPSVTPAWRLSATALSLKNGSVRLYVEVPAAGILKATADSAVAVSVTSHAAGGGAGTKRGHAAGRGRRTRLTVVQRDVASTKKTTGVAGGGLVELTLTLASRYRPLAAKSGGLYGTVSLVFTAPGHAALKESIPVVFAGKAKTSKAKKTASAKKTALAKTRAKGRR